VNGEFTPDSVSLVLDSGIAFTGDLPLMSRLALEDPRVLAESWQKLRDRGVITVYGAHSQPLPIEPAWADDNFDTQASRRSDAT
jgi:glyoxylase-like metal-dependent hydrolase (beta-lactamase superfamily II)